eukprot:UN22874
MGFINLFKVLIQKRFIDSSFRGSSPFLDLCHKFFSILIQLLCRLRMYADIHIPFYHQFLR